MSEKTPEQIAARKAKKAAADKARRAAAKTTAPKPKPKAVKVAAKKAAPKPKGGPRPGSGPKTQSKSGEVLVVISFRATAAQKKKCAKLGGGPWIRARIDAATPKAK